ncbi:hypothetical protein PV08_06108 [Exophiala spinifera]|uniref:N-acetylgalactosaminide beta-1,3-galactosyltransferase n=1 Tax=Exophiala spinifera TaxID=91928 RepID=A0A0D1ZTG5_9EURO|nr:uncharacterized protein PV08_06108 [Exophiala spinifera]KIW16057.1 hypothetical protein PV08_06108 [Exophiala spinifera]
MLLPSASHTRHSTRRIVTTVLLSTLVPLFVYYQNEKVHDVLKKIPLPIFQPPPPFTLSTYNESTQPIFPPKAESTDNHSDLCSNFPQRHLERVQIILKTGVALSSKNSAHLSSVTSCIHNLLVFSDVAQQVAGRDFIDILASLPAAYAKHPDFTAYSTQRETYQDTGKVPSSPDAWKLDRFKFLPMVNVAYEMRPGASWYVFLEADVYPFLDNLFRLLEQYNPQDMHYFGSAVAGSHGRWFAYGGAGIVLSHGLMKKLVGDGTNLSEKYMEWMLEDCCGDAVLGYAILDKTGVLLEDLHPMFSGEYLEDVGISQELWCVPLISLHRMSEDSLTSLWRWERTRRASQRPLVYSDLLEYRQRHLQNTSVLAFWDNLSADLLPSDDAACRSSSACAESCEKNTTCLQYSYTKNECRLSPYVTHGHAIGDRSVEFTSGWNRQRISELGLNVTGDMTSSCEAGTWTKPITHRCIFNGCA